MKLKEIMTWKVETVAPTDSVTEAARKMKQADVGMLPVVENERVIGVVTDRDLVVRAFGDGKAAATVRDTMTPHAICINQNSDLDEAIDKMLGHQVSRLVVENELGRVVGVLSQDDVAVVCAGDSRVGRLSQAIGKSHRHVGLPMMFG